VNHRVFLELVEDRAHSLVVSQELAPEFLDSAFASGVDESSEKGRADAASLIIVDDSNGRLCDSRLAPETDESCDPDSRFSTPGEWSDGTYCIVIDAIELGEVCKLGCGKGFLVRKESGVPRRWRKTPHAFHQKPLIPRMNSSAHNIDSTGKVNQLSVAAAIVISRFYFPARSTQDGEGVRFVGYGCGLEHLNHPSRKCRRPAFPSSCAQAFCKPGAKARRTVFTFSWLPFQELAVPKPG
jgi:hypothetical protein